MIEMKETFSYDDVLLEPGYSEVLPRDTDVSTILVRDVRLNVPVISAAMDTVTEEKMAVALALEGAAGVIHRNLKPEVQAEQVSNAKRYLNWIIESPVTVEDDRTIGDVKQLMHRYNVSGLPSSPAKASSSASSPAAISGFAATTPVRPRRHDKGYRRYRGQALNRRRTAEVRQAPHRKAPRHRP